MNHVWLLIALGFSAPALVACGGPKVSDDDDDSSGSTQHKSSGNGGSAGGSAGGSTRGTAGGTSGSSSTNTDAAQCSLQVASGSHEECDWADCGGFSDPDVCCSSVTDYRTVAGTKCDGSCIDLESDKNHCGACGTICPASQTCVSGACAVPTPSGGGGSSGGASSGGTSGGVAGSGGTSGGTAGGTASGGTSGGVAGKGGSGAGGSSGGAAGTGGSGAGGSSGGVAGTGGSGTGGTSGGVAGGSSSGGSGAGGTTSSVEPCASVSGWGLNCGANLTGADTDKLYMCNDGTTYGSVTCPSGCHAAAAGEPDYCIGDDPCVSAVSDGESCGGNLSPNADPNTLYNCKAQHTVSTTPCTECIPAGPGEADTCVPVEEGGGF